MPALTEQPNQVHDLYRQKWSNIKCEILYKVSNTEEEFNEKRTKYDHPKNTTLYLLARKTRLYVPFT